MEANVLCKPPKNTYTYRDGIQAIFVCVIMVDYKPLFFCVIIFFTFLTKPAYITTNIILYRVHTTVFSDPWVVQFLATRWIYPSDSPMRFSDISTLKKKMFVEITSATERQWNPRGQIRSRVQRLCGVITAKRRGK